MRTNIQRGIIVSAFGVAALFPISPAVTPTVTPAPAAGMTGRLLIRGANTLPAGADIRVNLLQAFDDARPFPLGTQAITSTAKTRTVPYSISYDPALVDPDGVYYLDAMIRVDGVLRWVTTGDSYVLTRGFPMDKVDLTLIPLPQAARPASGLMALPAASMRDVLAQDGRFDTLLSLADDAGLAGALQDGDAQTTLFAPTDEAFAQMPAGELDALRQDKARLREFLLYHQARGRLMSEVVRTRSQLATLLGATGLRLAVVGGKLVVNGDAEVTRADMVARNGVVHAVARVLTPPPW
jgi:uncharacterized surface protein with fasciclin (FAS1) repeats/uncharacterized lipoprotein YbaY